MKNGVKCCDVFSVLLENAVVSCRPRILFPIGNWTWNSFYVACGLCDLEIDVQRLRGIDFLKSIAIICRS